MKVVILFVAMLLMGGIANAQVTGCGGTTSSPTPCIDLRTGVAPANPPAGRGRIFMNSTGNVFSCILSTGASCASNFATTTLSGMTAGSVIFAGTAGLLSQDNANFFYSNAIDSLGIGTSTPGAILDVSALTAVGGPPAIRFQDMDLTTIPSYSALGFFPTISTSTIGVILNSSATTGGLSLGGYTVVTNAGAPTYLFGVHGGTAPTFPAIAAACFKHNGTTNRTALTTTEPCFGIYAGAGELMRVVAAGNVGILDASPTEGVLTVNGDISATTYETRTNCIANGTAASPSVVSCGSSSAGKFSCATNASTTTCQVNTTSVTANSEIFITQSAADGTALSVTCNTALALSTTLPILLSINAGVSFTLNMGTIAVNPACFHYRMTN